MPLKQTIYQYCRKCGELDAKSVGNHEVRYGLHQCKYAPKGRPITPPRLTFKRSIHYVENQPTKVPVGTRIVFLKTLEDGPNEDGPGNHYATKGDGGEVTGHECSEGHWVKWDHWPIAFGAKLGIDFEIVE